MDEKAFLEQVAKFNRPAVRLELSPGDPGPLPITKLAGIPWWPAGIDRPKCVDGHAMGFVAQFELNKVPGFESASSLISFHYCQQCAYAGNMAWGWKGNGQQLRYRVSVIPLTQSATIDKLGVTGESRVAAQKCGLTPVSDSLSLEDIWEKFPETAVPHGVPGFDKIAHCQASKLGGWPTWMQHPVRPQDSHGNQMDFVAQLDRHACPDSAWNTGCAYIFANHAGEAELVIQTT